MVCIYCGGKTNIINSRSAKKDLLTWRRHRCLNCHATVTTIEIYDLERSISVISKTKIIRPFSRDKLLLSIYTAVEHLDNSVETATYLTQVIIDTLLKTKPLNPLISTEGIYLATCRALKRFNAAAAVRYASYHLPLPLANDVKRLLRE